MHIEKVTSVTDELLAAFARLMPQLSNASAPTRADLDDLLASRSVLILARNPDEADPIVGLAALGVFRTPSGLHAHVEDVVVDESLRGQGLGEALVSRLLQIARELGLEGVSLTCNPRREAANRLYRRMGFREWKTNVYWYSLDDKS